MNEEDFRVDIEPTLEINGYSKLDGGNLEKSLEINGMTRVIGKLACDSVKVNGMLRCKAGLYVRGDLICNGMGSFKGLLLIDQNLVCAGKITVKNKLNVKGSVTLGGSLKVTDEFHIRGNLEGEGLIKCKDNLFCNQELNLKGVLLTDANVHASNLILKPSPSVDLFRKRSKIKGDVVIQNKVNIDNIEIYGSLQGRHISIQSDCEIHGPIYYTENVDVSSNAMLHFQPQKISEEKFPNRS